MALQTFFDERIVVCCWALFAALVHFFASSTLGLQKVFNFKFLLHELAEELGLYSFTLGLQKVFNFEFLLHELAEELSLYSFTLGLQKVFNFEFLLHELAEELGLYRDDGDVHPVPGNGLQHLQLRALDIQAEVVHPARGSL